MVKEILYKIEHKGVKKRLNYRCYLVLHYLETL